MKIQPMHKIAFNGSIKVVDAKKPVVVELDSDKILSFDTRKFNQNETRIEYDQPQKISHNGYTWEEPKVLTVKHDLNTILNAYNAAKNSNVKIDLSEYNNEQL